MELQNLKTNYLGKKSTIYKEIDSTQLEIWRKVRNNSIENGVLIVSHIQTNGMRNTWEKMVYG